MDTVCIIIILFVPLQAEGLGKQYVLYTAVASDDEGQG